VSVAGAGSQTPPARLVLADFDRAGWRTSLGDPFGGWDRDPGDPTQFCRPRLVEDPRLGTAGYSLRLDYDVDSPNPAYNGFWMKLPGIALQPFRTLSLAVRGDSDRGFTRRLKLELKDRRDAAVYILDGIGPEWVRMRIPLEAFRHIEKIEAATELVLVFEDEAVSERVGTLYVDEIALESAP
jgi:hypothetical protein